MLTANDIVEKAEQLVSEYSSQGKSMEDLMEDIGHDFAQVVIALRTLLDKTPTRHDTGLFVLGFYCGKTIQHDEFSLN